MVSAPCADDVDAPLPCLDEPGLANRVRGVFADAAYRADNVDALIGRPQANWRREAASRALRAGRDTPLTTLVKLFCGARRVDTGVLDAVLGSAGSAALEAAGLLARDGDEARATVQITPLGEHLYAHDLPARHHARAADFVVGPSPVARLLGALTVPTPVERALDLGCGAGVLALDTLTGARHVTAVDVNPRAVALTRFNAALNGCGNVTTHAGDLFAPLGEARFDLIISNPPFVIAPRATFVYRDGGAPICARIVREAPAHLATNGILQMLCNWPERTGSDWREVPRSWFDGCGCDAWVLRLRSQAALEYALAWLGQEYAGEPVPAAALAEWTDHLAGHDIAAVGTGLVVMRRSSGRPPWLELRDAPPLRGAAGASIARVLVARDAAARLHDDTALLEARLCPAPDLEHHSRRRPDGSGWRAAGAELRLAGGLGFAVKADPVATALLGQLDGKRSVFEALERVAAQGGVAASLLLPQLPAAVRRLLHLGLLVPAEAR